MSQPTSDSTAAAPRRQGRPPRADAVPAIIAAARTLFAEQGYRQVSVEDIIQRSGVSRPTVYRHFDGKDGIALAILEQFAEGARNAIFEAIDTAPTIHEMIQCGATAYMQAMINEGALLPELLDIRYITAHTKEIQSDQFQIYTSRINALLGERGQISIPIDYLEAWLIGIDQMISHICLKHLEAGRPIDAAQYIGEVKAFALKFGAGVIAGLLPNEQG